MRGEQIAEDLDALSLAHNLVVPPILAVAAFSATRLQGCQSSEIKSSPKLRNRAETLTLCEPLPNGGLKTHRIERTGP